MVDELYYIINNKIAIALQVPNVIFTSDNLCRGQPGLAGVVIITCMPKKTLTLLIVAGVVAGTGFFFYRNFQTSLVRMAYLRGWLRDPIANAGWAIRAGERCGNAPFIYPTDGLVGFIWDDSFRPGHRHQGLDIFAGTDVGVTPVIAAYDGYLTRLPDWKSSVIVRVPSDPLNPGQQIWVYYTHMADRNGKSYVAPDFPPGTSEIFVRAGTLLGYQGNYSGDPNNPVGIHLHISIVKDDGNGMFLNELKIANTLDPSPYFNMDLNANQNRDKIPTCNP